MRAMVVGGGIGGLTAAVALRRAGVEAVVFEKTGELREIGAGISLWANAMKALQKLGLYEAVLAIGKPLRPKGELRPPNGPPLYAGYVAWRGVAELGDEPSPGGGAFETWGRGERFGLVNLGRRRGYWYATKNAPKREENAGPGSGRKEELLARFGGWHEPIPTIIGVTEDSGIHRDGVYHREPAQRWGEGRITLLGDAAHPMTADLGQGACQAIEDAVVLARSLDEEGDIEAALRLYEERRADRVAYVVRQSRRLGRIGQLENPLLRRLRDATLRAIPKRVQLSAQLRQMEPVVG